ncbi:ABC transporter substrate-binding protein [Williamsia sp.]|uniref:ABC transporter substrate-binding protein n=1 Tax=Williamsia sp. TaxID=1872085 RepID=UPI002F948867
MSSIRFSLRAAAAGAAAVSLALVTGCGGDADLAVNSDGKIAVSVATVATESCLQGYIAADKGFFTGQGLDVDLKTVAGVPELAAAVTSGTANFACTAPTATATAYVQKLGFEAVAPGVMYTPERPATWIFVPADSPITSVEQLAGKTIAVNALNTLPHLSTLATLQDAGVDPDSVNFTKLDFSNTAQAIESKQVDAGVLQTPFAQDAVASGFARQLVSPYDAVNDSNPFVYTIWFGKDTAIEKNADATAKFNAAIVEASEWANDPANAAELRAIMQKATGISEAQLAGVEMTRYGTELTPELLQSQLDLLQRFGAIDTTVDAADIIYTPTDAP